ncbi:MAG: hypothetical protein JO247_19840 [Chloroflexi bacterium]|nr:hypothetical protein [Chloroflexota bacterium]
MRRFFRPRQQLGSSSRGRVYGAVGLRIREAGGIVGNCVQRVQRRSVLSGVSRGEACRLGIRPSIRRDDNGGAARRPGDV